MNHTDAQIDGEFKAMAGANIKWLRTQFNWAEIEAVKGDRVFTNIDKVTARAKLDKVNILAILSGCPLWANGNKQWYPPTDITNWLNYVSAIVDRYPEITTYEIWNEENIGFWMPKPSALQYLTLLQPTYKLLKSAGKKVVMGGLAGIALDYLEEFLKLGGADYIDATCYHPYATTLPCPWWVLWNRDPQEAIALDCLKKHKELVAKYTSKKLEIWLTEIGWSTQGFPFWEVVTEQQQAEYFVRTHILYEGKVDALFFYDLWEMANDKAPIWSSEWWSNMTAVNHYGIVKHDFTEKPGYTAIKGFLL